MKRLLRNLVLPVLLGAFAARAMAADALQNVEKQPINITAISMFLVFRRDDPGHHLLGRFQDQIDG